MDQVNFNITPNKFLRTLTILHLALMLGLIVFGIVVYFTTPKWQLNLLETDNLFFFVVPVLALGGVFIGNFMFKTFISNLKSKTSLKAKLFGFQTAALLKFALIEGPALFALVAALISANFFFVLVAVLLIFYMYTQKPTKQNVEAVLELSHEQSAQFRNGDQEID